MSRRALDDPDTRARVVDLLASGASVREAAREVGLAHNTIRREAERDPAFAAAIEAAKLEADAARAARAAREQEAERMAVETVAAELAERERTAEVQRVARAERIGSAADSLAAIVDEYGPALEVSDVPILETDELLRILSYHATHTASPCHETALKLLARFRLEPEIERLRSVIKAAIKAGDGGPKQRVLVLRIPIADGGGEGPG